MGGVKRRPNRRGNPHGTGAAQGKRPGCSVHLPGDQRDSPETALVARSKTNQTPVEVLRPALADVWDWLLRPKMEAALKTLLVKVGTPDNPEAAFERANVILQTASKPEAFSEAAQSRRSKRKRTRSLNGLVKTVPGKFGAGPLRDGYSLLRRSFVFDGGGFALGRPASLEGEDRPESYALIFQGCGRSAAGNSSPQGQSGATRRWSESDCWSAASNR